MKKKMLLILFSVFFVLNTGTTSNVMSLSNKNRLIWFKEAEDIGNLGN